MKIIKTFSGSEFMVPDKEAEMIARMFGSEKLLRLSTGEFINTKAIESVREPELVGYYGDHILDKEMRYFYRDGERIYLDGSEKPKLDLSPRYKLMKERYKELRDKFLNKTKMLSDAKRTEAQEETARLERKNKHF